MRLIKRQSNDINETVITFEYRKWNDELEEIVGFIKGKKEYISGYNQEKALCNIYKLVEIRIEKSYHISVDNKYVT